MMAGKVPYYYSELQNYSTGKRDQLLRSNNAAKVMHNQNSNCSQKYSGTSSKKLPTALYANEDGMKSVHSPIYEEIHENQSKPKNKIYQKFFGNKSSSMNSKRKKRSAPLPPEQYVDDDVNNIEVLDEVQEVHRQHDHTLQSLNLDMENMLMPDDHSPRHSTDEYNSLFWEDPNNSPITSPSATSTSSFHWLPAMMSGAYPQQSDSAFSPSPSSPKAMNEYTFPPPGENFQSWRSGTLPQPPIHPRASLSHRKQMQPAPYVLVPDGSVSYEQCDRQDNNIYEDLDANVRTCIPKHSSCDLIFKNDQAESFSFNPQCSSFESQQLNNDIQNGHADQHNDNWHSCNSSDSDCTTCSDSDHDVNNQALNTSTSKMLDMSKRRKKKKKVKGKENEYPGGFTRWFSGRKKEYDFAKGKEKLRSKLSLEEDIYIDVKIPRKQRHPPPALPPIPQGLSSHQMKRRYILENIIESENSYVNSLQRLTQDYKKPLEESNPSIINQNKIQSMFHRVEQILQCHTIFGIALSQCVREWDDKEKIGDVFVASFSKSLVLEIYSDFINNFSIAMETARHAVKSKSAFAEFLKVKQVTSPDRLSFFGLMVKPVQRFPQFILLIQDMLKHTPQGHHDRMSLQRALTELENLAETLNERKRESEQHYAVRELIKHISAKFSIRPISDGNRFLLRQDNFIQMERGQNGAIVKSKDRRLFLLNDLLVCVSISKAKNSSGYDNTSTDRMTLKWAVPLEDVELLDDPSVTRDLLVSSSWNKVSSKTKSNGEGKSLQTLYRDLSHLMHDFEVMSRISGLVSSLHGNYSELTCDVIKGISQSIQHSIQHKDEEIAFIDSCCLQLSIPVKSKNGKETAIFQTSSPSIKKEWITDLRLSKLALNVDNMPAWDFCEECRPLSRIPLFVSANPIYTAPYFTEVTCGCYYSAPCLNENENIYKPTQNFLWLCSSDSVNSQISILTNSLSCELKPVHSFQMVETRVTAMEAVPISQHILSHGWVIIRETVWLGTESRKIIIMGTTENNKHEELGIATVPASVINIKYYFDQIFVALTNGMVAIFRRLNDGNWKLKDPHLVLIGQCPVAHLLPIGHFMYAACGRKIVVLNPFYGEIQKNYNVHHEKVGTVNLMAQSGTGLWISLKNSATICLYHTETFKHLQDINVASNVNRVLVEQQHDRTPKLIFVTSLMANRGLLWVGTNMGVVLTIPLPRLEGVPIISGKASVSHHATCSSVTFLHALQPRSNQALNFPDPEDCYLPEESPHVDQSFTEKPKCRKQHSDSSIEPISAKPKARVLNRRSMLSEIGSSKSKTLPPGFSLADAMLLQESTTDVYGLYGDLFNITPYAQEGAEPFYETLRRSDPELSKLSIGTLDCRVRHENGRPRSLDLSNWSVAEDTDDSALYDSTPLTTDTTMSSSSSMTILQTGMKNSSPSNGDSSSSTNSVIPEPPVGRCGQVSVKSNEKQGQRTILTVVGGSGYVNWKRQIDTLKDNMNAHLIVWEMKA